MDGVTENLPRPYTFAKGWPWQDLLTSPNFTTYKNQLGEGVLWKCRSLDSKPRQMISCWGVGGGTGSCILKGLLPFACTWLVMMPGNTVWPPPQCGKQNWWTVWLRLALWPWGGDLIVSDLPFLVIPLSRGCPENYIRWVWMYFLENVKQHKM